MPDGVNHNEVLNEAGEAAGTGVDVHRVLPSRGDVPPVPQHRHLVRHAERHLLHTVAASAAVRHANSTENVYNTNSEPAAGLQWQHGPSRGRATIIIIIMSSSFVIVMARIDTTLP
jgi:hypothetical protein